MMGVKIEEIAQEAQEAFSRDSAEATSRGSIHSSNTPGHSGPTALLFIETDQFIIGSDPRADARELASQLIKQPEGSANLPELDKQLSWGPRRLNLSGAFLHLNEFVQSSKTLGAHP